MQELQEASVTWLGVTSNWLPRQGPLDPLSGAEPAEHPLSIRSLYVLLVVLLSAWVLGAALRSSAGFA